MTAAAVRWPAPPFFRLDGPQPVNMECSLTFVDGRVLSEELVEFEPGSSSIAVRAKAPPGTRRVDLVALRFIKLTHPVTYVADTEALGAIGAAIPAEDKRRPFTVTLTDGTQLTGRTLSFVKDSVGLFLFLIEDDAVAVINCFIPAKQIKSVQVGRKLGDVLVEKHAVKPELLDQALKKQANLRNERIGNYLVDRAIISPDELERAIGAQGKRPTMRLGEILIEAELITKEQLDEALAIQSAHRERRLGQILIAMGAVSLRLIQFAMSDKLGIPYVNVREFEIDTGALETIDTAFAVRNQVLPLMLIGESLVVAVEDPLAMDYAEDLRFLTTSIIAPVIANPQELKARIAKEYANLESRAAVALPDTGSASRAPNVAQAGVADLTSLLARETKQSDRVGNISVDGSRVAENTLVRLVNKIIVEAHAQGASDIHIESNAGKQHTRIRFRKDGDLEDYLDLPQAYAQSLVSRIKVMAQLDISEHRHPQDGKIDFSRHGPLPIELRVAIVPTSNGLEDVVLRILGGVEPIPLDDVGFSPSDLQRLKGMIARTYGLILVCGPTGSGKTTTLHSVLREINKPDMKIWTAEDPIEITQPGLRQVQVQSKIDWTFAAAMRAFLRADPDVIMVGEMRDAETTKIGIEASLTGHLVFSTLHTNSAAESIVRLLDFGMDPFNFADALIGILSQRLAARLCLNCKQPHVASDTEVTDLVEEYCSDTTLDPEAVLRGWRSQFWTKDHLVLRKAVGCDACRRGYKGRVIVYELLPGTPEVKHLVRSRATVPELVTVAKAAGMLTLRQNTIEKVLAGTLDLVSARAVSS